jgi:hypothetical protein
MPLPEKQDEENHVIDCPFWKEVQQYQQSLLWRQRSAQAAQYQQPQRRYLPCKKGCGNEVYYEVRAKSQNGRFLPLSRESGLPHKCR